MSEAEDVRRRVDAAPALREIFAASPAAQEWSSLEEDRV